MNPGTGALRVARGALLAALTALLAIAGHLAGGGHLPPMPSLLAGAVLLGATFAVLADKQRGLAPLLLAALGSQLLFHVTFELVGHSADAGLAPAPHLLVAHLCAAAVLALLAAHADTLLWSLVHLLVRAWIPALAAVPVHTVASSRPGYAHVAEPRIRLDARTHPRRGPPAL